VTIIANDGADANAITTMQKAIEGAGGMTKVIALHQGSIKCDGIELPAEESYLTAASVLFDAVYLPGGKKSVDALKAEPDILHFISEAYKHCKAIAADDEGVDLLKMTAAGEKIDENMDDVLAKGIVLNQTPEAFMKAIARHRFWVRQQPGKVPA
jgi:catalase